MLSTYNPHINYKTLKFQHLSHLFGAGGEESTSIEISISLIPSTTGIL